MEHNQKESSEHVEHRPNESRGGPRPNDCDGGGYAKHSADVSAEACQDDPEGRRDRGSYHEPEGESKEAGRTFREEANQSRKPAHQ